MSKQKEKKSNEDILAIARERFDLAVEAELEIRKEALSDLEFRAGKQWPDDMKMAREIDRRPCLTINRLPQFLRQVTNDQRQNRPSIKVSPVDDKADVETAKVYQGMIRHIEYNSNADVAYDTAFSGAATHGFGYFRVITDYCDLASFDQDILIKRIRNPFSVYLDPTYQEPDASDANWGFVFEELSIEDYRSQFKVSELATMHDWASVGDTAPGWVADKTVRVAEYFFKTFKEVTLAQLSDGTVVDKSKVPPQGFIGQDGLPVTIERERKSIEPAIKWLKINGIEVLEETEWLGKWIPVVPVLGDELDIDGKRVLEGIIRHAKDPQRMYNYWNSSATEMIALAPKAPYIGAAGQFTGFEESWKSANIKNHAYLEFNPKALNGQPMPPPQRQTYEPATQAITQAMMQSADDMKATTGIYDASLGARSNENSGVAIQRRNIQAQTNNFHYVDNLSRAMRHLGRILVDLIPHVYDTERAVRTLGEDGEQEIVVINKIFADGGPQKSYLLGHGKYDVTVSSGPSYQTKRQESSAAMLELAKSTPQLMTIAPDLVMKSLDFPGADLLAERFKKTLPPGMADDKDKGKQPVPPEAQAQMEQMNQMIEQLTGALNDANEKVNTKVLELESRERIENQKIQAQIEIEMFKGGSAEALALLKTEIAEIAQRQELLRQHLPIENENENPAESQQAAPPQDQPPTGGFSPGQNMGV